MSNRWPMSIGFEEKHFLWTSIITKTGGILYKEDNTFVACYSVSRQCDFK